MAYHSDNKVSSTYMDLQRATEAATALCGAEDVSQVIDDCKAAGMTTDELVRALGSMKPLPSPPPKIHMVGPWTFRVLSDSYNPAKHTKPKYYRVSLFGPVVQWCDCDHYKHRCNGKGKICKHGRMVLEHLRSMGRRVALPKPKKGAA